MQTDQCFACTGCPHAPPQGHWRAHPAAAPCRPRDPEGRRARTRQRHLAAVRGADRAYCAPRKRLCKPTNACLYQPPRDPEGRRARTRQRHLAAVRGADRAYCAPRKRLCKPTNACLYQPPRDPEGRRARTRQRHLAARLTYLLLWDYTLSGLIESRFFSSPAICTIEDTLRWWVPTPSIRSQSVQEAKYAT